MCTPDQTDCGDEGTGVGIAVGLRVAVGDEVGTGVGIEVGAGVVVGTEDGNGEGNGVGWYDGADRSSRRALSLVSFSSADDDLGFGCS